MWVTAAWETLVLVSLSVVIASLVGTATAIAAWLANVKWSSYMPLLMLAVPSWLLSIQMGEVFGHINPWLGASLSLGLSGAAYTHSMVSASLMNKSYRLLEAAKVLHGDSAKAYWVAAVPSLRYGLVPGAAFVAAEVLSDYGVSNFYGINTLTLTAFNVWSVSWNVLDVVPGLLLLTLAGLFLGVDQRKINVESSTSTSCNKVMATASLIPTAAVVGFSFYVSVMWTLTSPQEVDKLFDDLLGSGALVLLVTSACLVVVSVYVLRPNFLFERIGLLIYSVPGVVVGALTLYALGGVFPAAVLLGFALTLRYFGLAVHSLAASFKSSIDLIEAISVSAKGMKSFTYKVRLMLPSIWIGYSLVALDILKEIPISMILQPLNFSTLAMRMNYTSDLENVQGLGLHSLALMTIGLLLCFIMIRSVHVRG